jgi:hypothetical protein
VTGRLYVAGSEESNEGDAAEDEPHSVQALDRLAARTIERFAASD